MEWLPTYVYLQAETTRPVTGYTPVTGLIDNRVILSRVYGSPKRSLFNFHFFEFCQGQLVVIIAVAF